ncbi:MAG: hypothetical protein IAE96_04060 [Chitinophagaceae bacterium]|nr:hypothetical protein [Chitinophagaceae bacterium]
MRRILSERNIVILLFILVMLTFSLAQEYARSMGGPYTNTAQQTPADSGRQVQALWQQGR